MPLGQDGEQGQFLECSIFHDDPAIFRVNDRFGRKRTVQVRLSMTTDQNSFNMYRVAGCAHRVMGMCDAGRSEQLRLHAYWAYRCWFRYRVSFYVTVHVL